MNKRFGIIIFILFSPAIILAFYYLSIGLISQIYYLKANDYLRNGKYSQAIDNLKIAIHYQPNNARIWYALGKTYHLQGEPLSIQKAFHVSKKAKHAYLMALQLNPIEVESFFGLAREEERLEQLYPFIHQNKNPYSALPYYEEVIRLSPNMPYYHHMFARYLYQKGKTKALQKVITNLTRIFPGSYKSLKKEPFWSQVIKAAAKKGIQKAIDGNIDPYNAHGVMYSILVEEKDWAGAIVHFQKKSAFRKISHPALYDHSDHLFQLGILYMENEQLEKAEDSFFNAISNSKDPENTIARLYTTYKKNRLLEEFIKFSERISSNMPFSSAINIYIARAMLDLNRYEQARKILIEFTQKEESPTAYYWLYRIAEKEKDLDKMEMAIQKATMLAPNNSKYHLIFSQVLVRQKKFGLAEKETNLATKFAVKPSPDLYNHRALIRMHREDYQNAIKDWKSAISLQPAKAYFYYKVADAYEKMKDWKNAFEYMDKAINIDPKNKSFQKKYNFLQEKLELIQPG